MKNAMASTSLQKLCLIQPSLCSNGRPTNSSCKDAFNERVHKTSEDEHQILSKYGYRSTFVIGHNRIIKTLAVIWKPMIYFVSPLTHCKSLI